MTIEVRDAEVIRGLNLLLSAGEDVRPWLGVIGNNLKESTRLRFVSGSGPTGTAWAPLSPVTIARRRKGKGSGGAKPLMDTRDLSNSISSQVGANYVEVGTNKIYGRMQHFGAAKGAFGRGTYRTRKGSFPIPWGNVPGRPYLGLSPDDRAMALAVFAEAAVGQTNLRAAA